MFPSKILPTFMEELNHHLILLLAIHMTQKISLQRQKPVAHACNSSYLGGWDWEDCGSRSEEANGAQGAILK
jgi:hypothetical protein